MGVENAIFSKKELAEHLRRDWRTVRKMLLRSGLKEWLRECNISWKEFCAMRDLPPVVCTRVRAKFLAT